MKLRVERGDNVNYLLDADGRTMAVVNVAVNPHLMAAAPALLEAVEACLLREDIDGELGEQLLVARDLANGLIHV